MVADTERRVASFEARATGKGELSGLAAVYNEVEHGEMIAPGAFDESLAAGKNDIALLWQHDHSKPLARQSKGNVTVQSTARGLSFWARLNLANQRAREAWESIRDKLVYRMSVGFRVLQSSYRIIDNETVRVIEKAELLEISPVTFPWYSSTSVEARDKRPMDILELKQKRYRLVQAAEKAESTEERDQLLDEADAIGRDIQSRERLESTQARLREPEARRVPPMQPNNSGGLEPEHLDTPDAIEQFRDVRTGESLRVYRHGESMRQAPERRDVEPHALGRVMVAKITGNGRLAERELRDMGTSPNTAGGFLVSPEYSTQWWDLVRNQSVMSTAGMGTIPMNSETLTMARVTTAPTFAVVGEHGTYGESDAAFDAISMTAYKIGAIVRASKELIEDAPNAAQIIEQVMSAAMAVELDRLALLGSGSGEPLGITTNPAVQSTGSIGSVADYDEILDGIEDIQDYNGTARTWIMAPATSTIYAKIKTGDGTNSALGYLAPPPDVAALQKLVSNQAASGTVYLGDFSNTFMGVRLSPQIEFTDVGADTFEKYQVAFRITARVDFNLAYPKHINVLSGITA